MASTGKIPKNLLAWKVGLQPLASSRKAQHWLEHEYKYNLYAVPQIIFLFNSHRATSYFINAYMFLVWFDGLIWYCQKSRLVFVPDCMFMPSYNSHVEILTPNILGWKVFGKWWSHDGGAPRNGISSFIKETPERSLVPSDLWRYSKKMAIYKAGSDPSPYTESAGALTLNFPVSKTMRINFCCL